MKLFDTHCHLQDERLGADLAGVLTRAAAAGVGRVLCCGTSEADWQRVVELGVGLAGVGMAFGLHPWYVGSRTEGWLARLGSLLEAYPGAPVGEIGLDRALERFDAADQERVFRAQLDLADELGRAVSVHCRRAWDVLVGVLRERGGMRGGFAIHSYSGSAELVPVLAGYGAYFSFSGSLTYSGRKKGHQAACAVPLDRLLIETDAPDLAPYVAGVSGRGGARVNEPANLVRVLGKLAELRGESETALAAQLWENSERLFGSGVRERLLS